MCGQAVMLNFQKALSAPAQGHGDLALSPEWDLDVALYRQSHVDGPLNHLS